MSTTQNEKTPKEIVAATAAEPVFLGVDLANSEEYPTGVMSVHREQAKIVAVQGCILCDNTHEVLEGWFPYGPWVCDECKEAIAYLKEVKKWRGDSLLHG